MKEQLIKALKYNQHVNMMYISKTNTISKRRIQIIKIVGDTFTAFCFTRQAKRTFIISNVLAVTPVFQKEREVI
ncbi:transcriptional regulator [Lysinibacillus sphaericus]|uniref:transcriptional regulator n=1 Tax=Lysinibacillus sphaericus TaxID=1421 RepID=UPI0018CEC9AF|nr:transcriptional regulator [Lysinibacillus sphaericus]MBG9732296.1 transcriptional regulator [Lysinibacillus sphaericus]